MTASRKRRTRTTERGGVTQQDTEFETAQRALFESAGLETRSDFVELDTPPGRVHVVEAGAADDDPPVVFVHGTASFGAFFAPLMRHLDGRRLITFDRPGYGLSDPFTYTTRNIRRTVVDVLDGVLDDRGIEQADIVGHSMGGHTGLLYSARYPERVRRLTLLGSVPAFPGTEPPLPLRLMTVPILDRVLRRLQKSGEAGVLDIAEIFGERDAIQSHPAFITAIAAHEADPDRVATGMSEFGALFSIRGWHGPIRITPDELQAVTAPTTLVWGEHDTLGGPDVVTDGIASMPDARLERVPAGHIPFLDHPELCATLIRRGST